MAKNTTNAKTGLGIERCFSSPDSYPIEWTKSDVQITDELNKPLFVQKNVEFPNYFSTLAKQIVASRYFYGQPNTDERETSLKDLVERVSDTYGKWALKQGYLNEQESRIFKEEIANLVLKQMMSFNSPVWFNVGTDRYPSRRSKDRKEAYVIKGDKAIKIPRGQDHLYPQTSACFIQGLEDTMEDIMRLAVNEAMLFKYGSGTGTDLSNLRSSRERLSGGGKPSGPLTFWAHYDKLAGGVKSGGKTRRAAKMHSLRIDHPDIKEFIEAKRIEEKKIGILMDNGIESKEAISSVNYQNTNVSVRVSDKFMKAVENDEEWRTFAVHNHELDDAKNPDGNWIIPRYNARELFHLIAQCTWDCGDPGMQFDDIINRWHTCPNSGRIKASNPCSEYMFIDDSSCNLASLNLRGFVDENARFNTDDFGVAVRTTATAMDLNYDNSSFPTKKIAENSHRFRPLGMGYANLGSLIMSLGLPYDSDEGRAIAGAITALMTGKVYETSTEMAEKIGTFEEFEKNKEPMMKVMRMPQAALNTIDRSKLNGLENVLDEAYKTWDRVIERGEKYGFRNAQATVLAPTGTIGFMMDCDTKGIEPEIGLVQTKLLAEGGTLRMINGTVPFALKKLGYNEEEMAEIVMYISGHGLCAGRVPHLKEEDYKKFEKSKDKHEDLKKLGYPSEQINDIMRYVYGHETVEGCKILKEEHLPVFDCSNKPEWAKRTIDPMGHIKMMAAVQPFISGAISKTVNMPKEATVEDIENIYKQAHSLGLKAVAIYRDGSKRRQPLSFSKEKGLEEKVIAKPFRRKLPGTRKSITHKFNVAGHEGYLTVGMYDDGTPGELFITMSKEGATIGGLMDTLGTSISLNFQYGVPLESLVNKFKDQRFEPHGYVSEGHPDIVDTEVKSLVDYIFRFLGKTFLETKKENGKLENTRENNNPTILESKVNDNSLGITKIKVENESSREEYGGYCPCGARLIKKGHCYEICEENCGFIDLTGCAG